MKSKPSEGYRKIRRRIVCSNSMTKSMCCSKNAKNALGLL